MRIPTGFRFHEASDPKPEPQKEEKVTLDQRLKALQESDNELYSAVFGKGVTKGKKEVTEDHLRTAADERYVKTFKALTKELITRALAEKATERGFVVPEDAVEILQHSLALNDELEIVDPQTGEKTDVDVVIDSLAKRKPHLVKSNQKPGSSSKPPVANLGNGSSEKPTFKRSQLRDHAFFKANEAAIMDAARNNRIIDD